MENYEKSRIKKRVRLPPLEIGMDLKALSDSEVLSVLFVKVQSEKKLLAEIIEFVKEVDRRRLYLNLNYNSLFDYMTKHLGYTPGSAQRRIDAARMFAELPEVKDALKTGDLNLMQISTLARAVREKQKTSHVTIESKREILLAIQSQDISQSEKTVSAMLDIPIKTSEIKHTQKDDSVRMEMTLSKEQCDLLEEVKMLMSHVNPNPSFSDVFEFLAKKFVKAKTGLKGKAGLSRNSVDTSDKNFASKSEELGKVIKSKVGRKTVCMEMKSDSGKNPTVATKPIVGSNFKSTAKMAVNPRYISMTVRKQVFREQNCCQWSSGSKICGSKFQLQLDHIKPIWAGGVSEKQNLQVLCSLHNRQRYLQQSNIRSE